MQEIWDLGLIPWMRRSPGEGPSNPLQHSCLENPVERGAWWTTVHGVTKSGAQLSMQTTIASIFPSHWQCSLSSWATCCLCMLRFRNEDKSVGEKWDKSRAPLSLRFSCRVNGCLFVKKKKQWSFICKRPRFQSWKKDKCGSQAAGIWLIGLWPTKAIFFWEHVTKRYQLLYVSHVDKYYKLVLHVSGYKLDSVPDR